jgi:hypothetical protein
MDEKIEASPSGGKGRRFCDWLYQPVFLVSVCPNERLDSLFIFMDANLVKIVLLAR